MRVFVLTIASSFLIHFNGTDGALVDNKYMIYPADYKLDVPDDAKIVQIQSAIWQYPDVLIKGKNCTLRHFGHEALKESLDKCVLTPTNKYEYDVPKPGFSIIGFLKNPTMLMTFVSFGLMFAMPKLMETMEEEQGKDRPKDVRDTFLQIKS